MLKKLFPFEIDFNHEGLFGEYLSILLFVNESLTYLWLFLAFLDPGPETEILPPLGICRHPLFFQA